MEINYDFSSLDKLLAGLSAAPNIFAEEMGSAMNLATDDFYGAFTEYPPAPSYPIHWDTPKQKNAFFATEGFGGGIPHQRQGAYPATFQKTVEASPELVRGRVFSTAEFTQHIAGDRSRWSPGQSNIHAGRWDTDTKTYEKEKPKTDEMFREAIQRGLRRMADAMK